MLYDYPNVPEEAFCVTCEEFINIARADDHLRYCREAQEKLDLKSVNDKLIKLLYILNQKAKMIDKYAILNNESEYVLKASMIVDGCVNRIITTNDSLD